MSASNQLKKLLIIAGSDSGAGAGIQGDLKTAIAHGVYATTAITALTAQNTQGVSGIFDVSANFVAEQISMVMEDIGADAIKIGMLNNGGVITAVESSISSFNIPIVLDTVMLAKGGAPLLKNTAINALRSKLFPISRIVTPNIPEAEILAGMKIMTLEDMIEAGRKILEFGPHAVLVKGGHMWSSVIYDVVLTREKYEVFNHDKISTVRTHGTGCAMATAIACHLSRGVDVFAAVDYARQYIIAAIKAAPDIGKGHGPIGHFVP